MHARSRILTLALGCASSISAALAQTTSWVDVTPVFSRVTVRALATAPSDPSIVYAASDVGTFQTEDRGIHWSNRSDKSDVLTLAVDPRNAFVVWAGTGTIGE